MSVLAKVKHECPFIMSLYCYIIILELASNAQSNSNKTKVVFPVWHVDSGKIYEVEMTEFK